MRNAISLRAVRDIRMAPTSSVVISGTDTSDAEAEVYLPVSDIPHVAEALLCCAAMTVGPSPPLPGTIVKGCHLPLEQWLVGRSNVNGEPLLFLKVFGGSALGFQMAAQSARECGQALLNEGIAAAPPPGTRHQ